ILASELVAYWQNGSYKWPLDKLISVNSIETIDNRIPHDPNSPPSKYKKSWVGNSTGTPSVGMLNNAEMMGSFGDDDNGKCFLASMIDVNNADLSRMKDHYERSNRRFVLGSAEASVFFFSTRTGERIQRSIPVVVGFLVVSRPNCQQIALD